MSIDLNLPGKLSSPFSGHVDIWVFSYRLLPNLVDLLKSLQAGTTESRPANGHTQQVTAGCRVTKPNIFHDV